MQNTAKQKYRYPGLVDFYDITAYSITLPSTHIAAIPVVCLQFPSSLSFPRYHNYSVAVSGVCTNRL